MKSRHKHQVRKPSSSVSHTIGLGFLSKPAPIVSTVQAGRKELKDFGLPSWQNEEKMFDDVSHVDTGI